MGVDLGEPRFDDDEFEAKFSALTEDPPAVVSFYLRLSGQGAGR
jgi:hypothetical protein